LICKILLWYSVVKILTSLLATASGPYWPTTQEIDFFASRGMNTIRLPIEWERIQGTALANFDQNIWGRYAQLIDYITNTKGLYAIIDIHK